MANRSTEQRIAETLRRLGSDPNVWIATASPAGVPHIVPLSLAWIEERILVTTPSDTPTVRNVAVTGRARAALDSADDVVIIEAAATAARLDGIAADLIDLYVSRVGWDPRLEPGDWSLLTLRPRLIHAWNGVGEIEGRTIMRAGEWLAS